MPSFSLITARVAASAQIGFVKFILESYDGLATLSTINSESGEILLRFHPGRRDELLALLSALRVDYRSQKDQIT